LHTISGNIFPIFAISVFSEKNQKEEAVKKIKDKMKEQNIRSTVFSVSEN
jgi:hypothetical protein